MFKVNHKNSKHFVLMFNSAIFIFRFIIIKKI